MMTVPARRLPFAARLLALFALVAILVGPPAPAQAANLAPNPGFEQLCNNLPCSWFSTFGSVISSSTMAYAGSRSVQLTVGTASSLGVQSTCINGVVGANTYQLSIFYNSTATNLNGLNSTVTFYSGASCGGAMTNVKNTASTTADGQWHQAVFVVSAPQGAQSATLSFSPNCPFCSILLDEVFFDTTGNSPIFADVPAGYWARSQIESLYLNGVTSGCQTSPALLYCPSGIVARDQMAVFLVRALNPRGYVPPPAQGIFPDVPANYWAAPYIEQLFRQNVTTGCSVSPPQYCPTAPVTRDQLAVLLIRARFGPGYTPPPATGQFVDVPTTYWAAPYIEQLLTLNITTGCISSPSPASRYYCPTGNVTRDQLAVFLVRTFPNLGAAPAP